MQSFAHLRFADDVMPVVEALQRMRPIFAKDAREVFDGAPEGWFVIVMAVERPQDVLAVVTKLSLEGVDAMLLAADVRPEDDHYLATFINLRGLQQAVH